MKNSKILIAIMALMFVFLIGPFVVIIISSFSNDAVMRFPPRGFSLQWYEKVLNIQMFQTTFWMSLKTGLAATFTALLLGVPVAYTNVRFRYPGKNVLELFFSSPAIVPGLVIGFSLLRFFIYVTQVPILLGLYLGHTAILFPYTVRVVSASLRNFDPGIEEAAVSLGSTPLHAFFAWCCRTSDLVWSLPSSWLSSRRSTTYRSPCFSQTRCRDPSHTDADLYGVLF